MATYLVLAKVTPEGAREPQSVPEEIEFTRKAIAQNGGQLKAFYYTQGRFDAVLIIEHPDDLQFMAGNLGANSSGRFHTETLRAYDENELRQMVKLMGEGPPSR